MISGAIYLFTAKDYGRKSSGCEMNLKKATRSDWKIQPMPELKTWLQIEEIFTKEEYIYLTWGLIPMSMDDKWFIYVEDDWLYFHRSWTGDCIFQVRLERFEDGYLIAEAWVNCDQNQRYDKDILFWIGFLIRINQDKEYCCGRVIIAFFICIFIKEASANINMFINPNFLVFIISFLSHLFSNLNSNHWGFHGDLYDFIDYYCKCN
ncbi:MAG: hypothetical protein HC907_30645 [Richelia sp. SM1_7_0]|nr:hypothetical protein [Richelia sp. SM1_7_0]